MLSFTLASADQFSETTSIYPPSEMGFLRRIADFFMGLAISLAGETSKFVSVHGGRLRTSLKKKKLLATIKRFEHRSTPDRLETLCQMTGFTKPEMKTLYRGFKEACPSGRITEDDFKIQMSHWFPGGLAGNYAALVFKTFDTRFDNSITFKDFVVALSTLSRGSIEERLAWIFYLYDIDQDGYISKEDIHHVVRAMYDIVGSQVDPPIHSEDIRKHANEIFNKFDKDHRGLVGREEFLNRCMEDESILESLHAMDTIFHKQGSQDSKLMEFDNKLIPADV